MSVGLADRSGWVRAALLVLALFALSMRLLVPAGYMPDSGHGLTLTLCTGTGPASINIDLGKRSQHDQGGGDHAPCAFGAAAMPLLSGVPPVLLALALADIARRGVNPDPAPPATAAPRLRPPLRGPPSVRRLDRPD